MRRNAAVLSMCVCVCSYPVGAHTIIVFPCVLSPAAPSKIPPASMRTYSTFPCRPFEHHMCERMRVRVARISMHTHTHIRGASFIVRTMKCVSQPSKIEREIESDVLTFRAHTTGRNTQT